VEYDVEIAYLITAQQPTDHKKWSNSMPNPIKHYTLTPEQSEEKALIVAAMKMEPRGPWVNGKMTSLPKLKGQRTDAKNKK
jgi:hypothetical protein